MSKTFILLDLNNLLHRAKHVTMSSDPTIKVGMAISIVFASINKMWKKFNASHLVVCLDGKSWRREVYENYKLGRRLTQSAKTVREQEEDELFNEAFSDLIKFLREKSNASVLQSQGLEADDFIARWITLHPEDHHIIISSDSDFYQLLSDNVEIYNGITNLLITKEAVYDDKDKKYEFTLKNDGKIKLGKENSNFTPPEDWIEWAKFSKIMRGDAGDGIFTAYPKIRQTQLRNAFEDRKNKGYIWNNLMLQTWKDHEGEIHRVLDDFNRNKLLIDLNEIPIEIAELADNIIREQTLIKSLPQIGIWFLKFCSKYELERMTKSPDQYIKFLSASYTGN